MASNSYGWDVRNISQNQPKNGQKQPFFNFFRFSQKVFERFERNFLQSFYAIIWSYECNFNKLVWLGIKRDRRQKTTADSFTEADLPLNFSLLSPLFLSARLLIYCFSPSVLPRRGLSISSTRVWVLLTFQSNNWVSLRLLAVLPIVRMLAAPCYRIRQICTLEIVSEEFLFERKWDKNLICIRPYGETEWAISMMVYNVAGSNLQLFINNNKQRLYHLDGHLITLDYCHFSLINCIVLF